MTKRKIIGTLIGAVIGAVLVAICSRTGLALAAGAIVGGIIGLVFTVSRIRMEHENETGATW